MSTLSAISPNSSQVVIACFDATGLRAILPGTVLRPMRAFGAMVATDRLAGGRARNKFGIADLADEDAPPSRATEVGTTLRGTDDAGVLNLGRAGTASCRNSLETALGIPVIDLCQAATAAALGRIALNKNH